MAKQPWLKFYPSDWRGAARLRMCSLAARGLLVEMMAIMHEAEPYGFLLIAGKPLDDADLAVQVGAPRKEVARLRSELERNGVIRRNEFGVLMNPRMIRDEETRQKRAAGGRQSLLNPNVPQPKDILDGTGEGIHKGPPQIPDARSQIQIKQKTETEGAHAPRGKTEHIGETVGKIIASIRPAANE